MNKNNYFIKEEQCLLVFSKLGKCFHLWTPENFEIIFRNDSEFRIGMGIIANAAKCFPDAMIITFVLMTNHLHLLVAGEESQIMAMYELIVKYLKRMVEDSGRTINWRMFKPGIRLLKDLSDARNVLIYDNRNGFLVHNDFTPFSYPWGSNFCFFNPDAKKRYLESSFPSTIKDRRSITHSHVSDELIGLRLLDQCFSPFSFCSIDIGESLFRDAVHYFSSLCKNIEQNIEIAKEIGESISYTDDELYASISRKCKEKYGTPNPSLISGEEKILMAKLMYFEYNAGIKQIQRILRMDSSTLSSMFGNRE